MVLYNRIRKTPLRQIREGIPSIAPAHQQMLVPLPRVFMNTMPDEPLIAIFRKHSLISLYRLLLRADQPVIGALYRHIDQAGRRQTQPYRMPPPRPSQPCPVSSLP